MRAAFLSVVTLAFMGACSSASHRGEMLADAHADEVVTDAASEAPEADGGEGDVHDASAGPAHDAATELDADSALQVADAQLAPTDASALPPIDAPLIEYDATLPPCSFAPDAGATAVLECSGFVCGADGGTYVALTQKQPWYVGGLSWAGSLCRRPLGWAPFMTSDARYILFPWQAREVFEFGAGMPLFVYWAGPYDGPNERAARCVLSPRQEPLPVCPSTGTALSDPSLTGCRGPTEPGCATCVHWSSPTAFDYRSAQQGADAYHIWSTTPAASCGPDCPSCASCTIAEERDLKALKRLPQCEPCGAVTEFDPCFGGGEYCPCYCSKFNRLRKACPSLAK